MTKTKKLLFFIVAVSQIFSPSAARAVAADDALRIGQESAASAAIQAQLRQAGLEEPEQDEPRAGYADLLKIVFQGQAHTEEEAWAHENFQLLTQIFGNAQTAQQLVRQRSGVLHVPAYWLVHGLLREDGIRAIASDFVWQERSKERYDTMVVGGGSAGQLAGRALGSNHLRPLILTLGSDNGGLTQTRIEQFKDKYGWTFPVGDITAAMMITELKRSIWNKRGLKDVEKPLTQHIVDLAQEAIRGNPEWANTDPDFVQSLIELINLARAAEQSIAPTIVAADKGREYSIRHELFNALMVMTGAYSSQSRGIAPGNFEKGLYLLEHALGMTGRVVPNSVDEQTLVVEWNRGDERPLIKEGQVNVSLAKDSEKTTSGGRLATPSSLRVFRPETQDPVLPYPGVVSAIEQIRPGATIHHGPSSVLASRSPQLAIPAIADAIARRKDVGKVLWMNLTRNDETIGMTLRDLVDLHTWLTGRDFSDTVDYIIINDEAPFPEARDAALGLAREAGGYAQALAWVSESDPRAVRVIRQLNQMKIRNAPRQMRLALGFADWASVPTEGETWKFRGMWEVADGEIAWFKTNEATRGVQLYRLPLAAFGHTTAMRVGYGGDRKEVRLPIPTHNPTQYRHVDQLVRADIADRMSLSGAATGLEEGFRLTPREIFERLDPVLNYPPARVIMADLDDVTAPRGEPAEQPTLDVYAGFLRDPGDKHDTKIVITTDRSPTQVLSRVMDGMPQDISRRMYALYLSGARYLDGFSIPESALGVIDRSIARMGSKETVLRMRQWRQDRANGLLISDELLSKGYEVTRNLQTGEIVSIAIGFDSDFMQRQRNENSGRDPRPRWVVDLKAEMRQKKPRGVSSEEYEELLTMIRPGGSASINWMPPKGLALWQWIERENIGVPPRAIDPRETVFVDDLSENFRNFPRVHEWKGLLLLVGAYDPALKNIPQLVQVGRPEEPKPANCTEINRVYVQTVRAMHKLGWTPENVQQWRAQAAAERRPVVEWILEQAGLSMPSTAPQVSSQEAMSIPRPYVPPPVPVLQQELHRLTIRILPGRAAITKVVVSPTAVSEGALMGLLTLFPRLHVYILVENELLVAKTRQTLRSFGIYDWRVYNLNEKPYDGNYERAVQYLEKLELKLETGVEVVRIRTLMELLNLTAPLLDFNHDEASLPKEATAELARFMDAIEFAQKNAEIWV